MGRQSIHYDRWRSLLQRQTLRADTSAATGSLLMHRAWTNLLLMIVICIAIFIIFIALRPAEAGNITDWKCGESVSEVAAHTELPHKRRTVRWSCRPLTPAEFLKG